MKTKTGSEVAIAFESIMTETHPKKLWVNQGSELYNKTVDKLLKVNPQIYTIHSLKLLKI